MFVGHYAASFAAKAVAPRLPAWAAIGAAQLVDIGWAGLVLAGIEKVRLDPALPGSPLVLYFMPYTHSLPAALLWSLAGGALAARVWGRQGWLIGAVVFSHWLADLLVHRPDLPLGFTGPKLGLALWNFPALEMAVEFGLLGLAMLAWVATRKTVGQRAGPAIALFALLFGLAVVGMLPGGGPTTPAAMALLAWFGYGVSMIGGALVDWRDRARR